MMQIFSFGQQQYAPLPLESISMGPTGYVYVPTACQQGARTLALSLSLSFSLSQLLLILLAAWLGQCASWWWPSMAAK
jgi:hypothetical protein